MSFVGCWRSKVSRSPVWNEEWRRSSLVLSWQLRREPPVATHSRWAEFQGHLWISKFNHYTHVDHEQLETKSKKNNRFDVEAFDWEHRDQEPARCEGFFAVGVTDFILELGSLEAFIMEMMFRSRIFWPRMPMNSTSVGSIIHHRLDVAFFCQWHRRVIGLISTTCWRLDFSLLRVKSAELSECLPQMTDESSHGSLKATWEKKTCQCTVCMHVFEFILVCLQVLGKLPGCTCCCRCCCCSWSCFSFS